MSTLLLLKMSESDTRYGFRPAIAARDLLHQQLECKLYTVPTVCTVLGTACCVACLARTLAAAWLAVLSWL